MSGIQIPTVLYNIQIPLSYVLFKFRYYWYVQICFHMKPIQTYLRGAFINDVMLRPGQVVKLSTSGRLAALFRAGVCLVSV